MATGLETQREPLDCPLINNRFHSDSGLSPRKDAPRRRRDDPTPIELMPHDFRQGSALYFGSLSQPSATSLGGLIPDGLLTLGTGSRNATPSA